MKDDECRKITFCAKRSWYAIETYDKIKGMKEVIIYTDGACSGNPGPGGWGSVLQYKGQEKELSGAKLTTTNNEMELTAVVRALQELKEPCTVHVYSDSSYVVNAVNQRWLIQWKSRGWRNSQKKILPNLELWKELDEQLDIHQCTFHWVKGHADNPYNNRCDALAVNARLRLVETNE